MCGPQRDSQQAGLTVTSPIKLHCKRLLPLLYVFTIYSQRSLIFDAVTTLIGPLC